MSTKVEYIDVDVPVHVAYNQWTQFETFPQFMGGVESITQVDDVTNHWVTKVGGVKREFDTKISEQVPDEKIAWSSVDGTTHSGVVTFHHLSDTSCRTTVQMDVEPEGLVEKAGDKLGIISGRIEDDLKKFKEFIESSGHETGGWRGQVDQKH